MRINKVEELVGITKKNIRFYEEKGLLNPARNTENGYREYYDEDVDTLRKIKLFRQLSVPIEEILKMQQGYLTLEDCMRRHIIALDREEENIMQQKAICGQLEISGEQLVHLDAKKYLLLMEEKEGVRFLKVEDIDQKRKAPIISTIVMIVIMLALMGLFLWAAKVDPIHLPLLLFLMAIPAAVIVGVLMALKERMKQIEGGEEDAARKY